MPQTLYDLKGKRVWVAGQSGMVGSALTRRLEREQCSEIITAPRSNIDLRRQEQVENWMRSTRPQAIFVAAAKVGGIQANNSYPADFLHDNLAIVSNIIGAAFETKVEKLIFLGSSCIYPKRAPQPITENSLLTGPLEPTNQWYAIAKIAGIKLCEAYRLQHGCDFISAMPTNLYGPNDNFNLSSGHVLPALIRKAHEAKQRGDPEMVVWGTGTPRREFLHSDDCADGILFLMKHYSDTSHVNIGSGADLTIREAAELVQEIVGFKGTLSFDVSKPDGTPRKLMSNARLIGMGWSPRIPLRQGLRDTYQWFLDNRGGREGG